MIEVVPVVKELRLGTTERLCRASPYWMRHALTTPALQRGVHLTTMRKDLLHASVSTTSGHLHTDKQKRARQLAAAFAGRAH